MARPTDSPRLATLDVKTLVTHVVRAAASQYGALTTMLYRRGRGRRPTPTFAPLAAAVTAVVGYAQWGTPRAWDCTNDLFSSVNTVGTALWSRVADFYNGVPTFAEAADVTTPIGLAIVAALARHKIMNNALVTAQELGALAGVTAHHIRLLGRAEGVTIDRRSPRKGLVSAHEARAFLDRRGVPGSHQKMERARHWGWKDQAP
jgi:hypothetical protein